MHIGGAHLHSHMNQAPVSTSAAAAKRAEETRKRLFASAEGLEMTATAESAWMIGAWGGGGEDGSRHGGAHHGTDSGVNGGSSREAKTEKRVEHAAGDPSKRPSPERDSQMQPPSALAVEQSAIAGAQALAMQAGQRASAVGYGGYAAGARVEKSPEVRQVSYWA